MRSILIGIPSPGSPLLVVLALFYWILLVPYIEEWFWREWMLENIQN